MKKITKILSLLALAGIIILPFVLNAHVFAQTNYYPPTLVPGSDINVGSGSYGACVGLATMIKTGNIHLSNIPCFIMYFTQTLVGLAGSLSVVFIMAGGYRYVISSDEGKDKAKKTITYALIGLAVSLLAWVAIDLVIQVATE